MILLGSLIFVIILFLTVEKPLRKHPLIGYSIMAALTIIIAYLYANKLQKTMPIWLSRYVLGSFKRGAISTAIFIVVMFVGVLPKQHLIKRLMNIRCEMAIIASISIFGHNLVYGLYYFKILFTDPFSLDFYRLTAAVLTILMLALLLPLFITSFRSIRNKMNAKTWKNIQKLAYPFFILIYFHVMLLYIPKWQERLVDMIIYSIIWGGYLFIRVLNTMKANKKRKSMSYRKAPNF